MSRKLVNIEGLNVVAFGSTPQCGPCLQFDIGGKGEGPGVGGYAQMTKSNVKHLVEVLNQWLEEHP